MRKLAAFVSESSPQILGVCEIESGDALALATRFAMQWAYRGRQALFWRAPVRVDRVHDRYLPMRGGRIFDRRGLLVAEAEIDEAPCILAATQLSVQRDSYVPELRFARAHLRGDTPALLFAQAPPPAKRFADLGFQELAEGVFIRGFSAPSVRAVTATV
jgi:hypothetical protein